MSNTIIMGDIAEGQKWFGEAEFLKQQLKHLYNRKEALNAVVNTANTAIGRPAWTANPYMSTWKQVTADVKIYVKMVNGVPQAFIYTTQGGLFVTFWDTDTAVAPNIYAVYDELYVGRLLYKDTLTPSKKDNYKVGGSGYWYSADKKESISWNKPPPLYLYDPAYVYVKGVRYSIDSFIECAAIRKGVLVVLVGIYNYNHTRVTGFRLSTYRTVPNSLEEVTTSYLQINPTIPNTNNPWSSDEPNSVRSFEISKDLTTITFIANSIIYKLDISEGYVLAGLTKVLVLPRSASIRTVSSSSSINSLVASNSSQSGSSSGSTINDPTGVGSIVTGKLVGHLYHYIYAVNLRVGTEAFNETQAITRWTTVGTGGGGFIEIKEGYRHTYSSSSYTSSVSIKVGIVDLDTLINILDTETLYSEAYTSSNSESSSATWVPSGSIYHANYGAFLDWPLNELQYTYSKNSSAEHFSFSIVAFYPEKKVCVLKVNKASTGSSESITSRTNTATDFDKLIILKNNVAIDQSGSQNLYTYSPYKIIQSTTPQINSYSSTQNVEVGGIYMPLGLNSSSSGTVTDQSQPSTTPIIEKYDFSENSKILATKARISSYMVPDIVYQLVLDIDKNIAEEYQTSDQTIEGQKILQRVFSTTTT